MNNIKPRDMDVFEIFDELVTIKDRKNQIEWLRDNFSDHTPLMRVLKMNFCSTIVTMLPEGEPPFTKESSDGPTRSSLWNYLRHFPVFVRSAQSMKMRPTQIEKIFIECLESIEPKEAEMLCLAKDRQLQTRWDLDLDLFKTAFPGLAINDAVIEIKEVPVEDKAENLIQTAKEFRAKAKELQATAREYEKEAKELTSAMEKNDAATG